MRMRQYKFTKSRSSLSSLHECSICGKKLEIGDTIVSIVEKGNYKLNHGECYYKLGWK